MKRALLLLACLPLVASCKPAGAGDPRPFQLASTTVRAFPDSTPAIRLESRRLSGEVEVVSIHQDFLGIPWTAFRDRRPPPIPWVAAIEALRASAGRQPVFLSLALVNGEGRAYLDDDVGPDGLARISSWSAICFDFERNPEAEALQEAYINYALWMIDRFQPRWLNIGIELNRFRESCDARTWTALVGAESAIYRAIKARHPDLLVFPSLVLEDLYGLNGSTCTGTASECLEAAAPDFELRLQELEGLRMDRLALSTYPFEHPSMTEPEEIPADYFTRLTSRMEAPLIFAETGWPAEEIRYAIDPTTGPCTSYLMGSPQKQSRYLERITAEAEAHGSELLTWWSSRDLLLSGLSSTCSTIDREFDCVNHPGWCDLVMDARGGGRGWAGELALKTSGTLGLRDHEGQGREPMATTWSELRDRPLEGP